MKKTKFLLAFAFLAAAVALPHSNALAISFDLKVKVTRNLFTPEADANAADYGLLSNFSSIAVGSYFFVSGFVDIDPGYLLQDNFHDDYWDKASFSWSARNEGGEFASGYDSVMFLNKSDGIFDFYGVGYSWYGMGFRIDTKSWQGSLSIQGEEAFDWYASLDTEIVGAKFSVPGARPVPDQGTTLLLLGMASAGLLAWWRRSTRCLRDRSQS